MPLETTDPMLAPSPSSQADFSPPAAPVGASVQSRAVHGVQETPYSAERENSSALQQDATTADRESAQVYISAVIPVYNSVRSIGETIRRTAEVLEKLGVTYEIIAVNDGSPDGSWAVLEEEARRNPNVVAINLVKNYGQHPALFCGLVQSRGKFVVTLDDDLQNPPEEIVHLIEKGEEGYDLVCGKYRKKGHELYRRWGSKLISLVNEKIFSKPRDFSLTNFRLMERKLVYRICQYRTAYPYVNGLAVMFSGRMANVVVEHHDRTIGQSNYSLGRILKLVLTILFNYSPYPLRFVCGIGLGVSAVSFFLGIFYLLKGILLGSAVHGWTTLVTLLAFFNGFLTLMVGMLGEYTIRILNTTADHRSYHIREIFRVD
jgi:Glycosyltransferases involved in cell wall biogenesis